MRRPASRWLIALGAIYTAYCLALLALAPMSLADILRTAAANVAPVVPLTIIARQLWLHVRSWPFGWFLAVQVLAASVFAVVWYWAVAVLLGLSAGETSQGFLIQPFKSGALPWQLLQGVLVYGLVCALIENELRLGTEPGARSSQSHRDAGPLLVKVSDEIVPLDSADIIMISGAQDYCEIRCRNSINLSRMSLRDLEATLPSGLFLRVHRSHIVNLERLVRAEPAGSGRMTLHLEGGLTVTSSRDGARALRNRLL